MTSERATVPIEGGFIIKRPTKCRIHPTFEIAGAEAVRMSENYPDPGFLVLKVVGRVVTASSQSQESGAVASPPASPPSPPPVGGGLVSERVSLVPDVKVTRQAIQRLVGSLTGDPLEHAAIVASAAFAEVAEVLQSQAAAIDLFENAYATSTWTKAA